VEEVSKGTFFQRHRQKLGRSPKGNTVPGQPFPSQVEKALSGHRAWNPGMATESRAAWQISSLQYRECLAREWEKMLDLIPFCPPKLPGPPTDQTQAESKGRAPVLVRLLAPWAGGRGTWRVEEGTPTHTWWRFPEVPKHLEFNSLGVTPLEWNSGQLLKTERLHNLCYPGITALIFITKMIF
jgi:hypothetical protein